MKNITCHDCGKNLSKGDEFVRFEGAATKEEAIKCKDCFETSPVLENFQACDVYSRVVGFHTPIQRWNKGKSAEWTDRKTFVVEVPGCAC
ncbi:MAG: anaerobic ribonucleoside-triphosphate reductase [Candidatus Moraniibacteriota bacterium]